MYILKSLLGFAEIAGNHFPLAVTINFVICTLSYILLHIAVH